MGTKSQDDGLQIPSPRDQLRQFAGKMRFNGNKKYPVKDLAQFPIVHSALDDLPIQLDLEERIAFVEYLFAELVYRHRNLYVEEGFDCPCTRTVARHSVKYVNISHCIAALRLGSTAPNGQRLEALTVIQVADLVNNGQIVNGQYSYGGDHPTLKSLVIDPLTAKTCAAIYLDQHKNSVVDDSIRGRLAVVIESLLYHWSGEDSLFQEARRRVLARPQFAAKLPRSPIAMVTPDQVPGTSQAIPVISTPELATEMQADLPEQAVLPASASGAPLAEPPVVEGKRLWRPTTTAPLLQNRKLWSLLIIPIVLIICLTLLVTSSSAAQGGGTIAASAGASVQSRNMGALPRQLADGAPRWYLLDVMQPEGPKQVMIFDRVRDKLYPIWPDDHLNLWNDWLITAHFLSLPTISTSAYSPSTQDLALAMKTNDTTSIWIAHLDLQDLRPSLTHLPQLVLADCGECTTLSWSPHGRVLLFNSANGLRALTLATHAISIITSNAQDVFPACSHDGQQLAYESEQKTIWVLATTNCLPAVPTAAIREIVGIAPAWHAAWSTDDSRLYFASTYAGNGTKIYSVATTVMPTPNSSPQILQITQISGADDCFDPAWSVGADKQIGYLIYLCATQDNGTKVTRLIILADPALQPTATPTAIPLPTVAYHPQSLSAP